MADRISCSTFIPVGDGSIFGQLETISLVSKWMGHSDNDRTRLSAAVFSSSDGDVDPSLRAEFVSTSFAGSQAFSTGKLGVQRLGAYVMYGVSTTTY